VGQEGNFGLNGILPTALLILGLAANASAQQIPKWELFGGFSEYLSNGGTGARKELPTHGVQVELDRVVTSYFRITGQFNAQFADEVVDLAPLAPGASHVNSKELLGLFGPEATYRAPKKLDIYGHYLIGLAYGRDNHDPAIPTATYTTWAYALGCGVDWKLGRPVSIRIFGFDWISTHFPINSPEKQDDWRLSSGFVFHFGY
jgi:hypothetical protein